MSDLDVEEIDQTGDDEVTSLEEGKILDYITGEPVKDTPKEQVRQRIARALFLEYGISVEDMVPDFKMKVDGRQKKIDIAILPQRQPSASSWPNTYEGRKFNKLVVFDEAHKYIESPDLVAGLVEVVREMRHKGTSIMVASQDPPSVPVQLIELSSQIILHKFNSPAWLKHIQKANAALGGLTPEKMAHLRPGEAFVWSSKATDEAFSKGAIKVRCRPRATQHGGATKTAVRD